MDLRFSDEDEAFRREVRDWLAEHNVGDFAAVEGRGGPGHEHESVELRREWERVLALSNHIVVVRPGYELSAEHVQPAIRERINDLSSLTPLISIAAQQIFHDVTAGTEAERVFSLVIGGGSSIGEALLADERVALIQATGSCALGERVSVVMAKRSGRAILELGGNNAVVVLADADLKLALRAVVFGTVGTAGQRCTSTRRLILHRPIAKDFMEQLTAAYRTIGIGDPLDDATLMGPLVSQSAVEDYREGLAEMQRQGGKLVYGGNVLADRGGYFVEPAIVRSTVDMPICKEEVFAPIVHVFEVEGLEEAIAVNNSVPQGLSSGLFTTNLAAAERWLSAVGSDCGIANVNAGTSGAEIGGAFGGEKATGGGRQAGSDAWKGYMRRQTCTINYGDELPLAQGVTFPVD